MSFQKFLECDIAWVCEYAPRESGAKLNIKFDLSK